MNQIPPSTESAHPMKRLLVTALAIVPLMGCHMDSVYTGLAEQALFDDVREGNIQQVREFLRDGGDVNTQDEPGCTPLHWAVNEDFQGSHRELVELLIANGADVNAVDDLGTTPLHLASNRETAEILIECGANVNAKDHAGQTLLWDATRGAANNHPNTGAMYLDLVNLLVSRGVELDAQDTAGQTALHALVTAFDQRKASELCDLLVAGGASVNVINNAGQTPLDIAIHEERDKTAGHLRNHGAKTAGELKADSN